MRARRRRRGAVASWPCSPPAPGTSRQALTTTEKDSVGLKSVSAGVGVFCRSHGRHLWPAPACRLAFGVH